MKELKEYVRLNPHVEVVYFDQHGNWFLHKGRTVVSQKTRSEILGGKEAEEAGESNEAPKGESKKKK